MNSSQRSTIYRKWLRWIEKIDNDITTLFADREVHLRPLRPLKGL